MNQSIGRSLLIGINNLPVTCLRLSTSSNLMQAGQKILERNRVLHIYWLLQLQKIVKAY